MLYILEAFGSPRSNSVDQSQRMLIFAISSSAATHNPKVSTIATSHQLKFPFNFEVLQNSGLLIALCTLCFGTAWESEMAFASTWSVSVSAPHSTLHGQEVRLGISTAKAVVTGRSLKSTFLGAGQGTKLACEGKQATHDKHNGLMVSTATMTVDEPSTKDDTSTLPIKTELLVSPLSLLSASDLISAWGIAFPVL